MRYTVLDTETNGLQNSSVLEFYAINFDLDETGDPFDFEQIHRFYYPIEDYNYFAYKIHGLNKDRIKLLRKDCDYAEYFFQDEDIGKFLLKSDCIVGHNISFDLSFIKPCYIKENTKIICTMKENKHILKLKGKRGIKNPKLIETAEFYKIYQSDDMFHGAKYDTEITMNIFIQMVKKGLLNVSKK
ncbi:MAG: hypothetical protein C0601_00100 [Candidatus Muiribacterium halophilum]|uniref:Exonuclease domain-containing protein n=1 Tax=Muiribacterium halophilum TaxID=2053465 RepID=A0A2N5ZNB1_MUIH1|nr:MAG: hypothetical protein C0601_00100 [Candidatus Muirbacterium halophilum]